ncbi:hypothetical protein [Pseudomonas granadensis]|uniref:hypothetical protein n=1 Tax=Pseudomonas granadensis TaxID=1421430 RepID=UPI000B7E2F6F|nr:hypothetical protein [Pseudomonas granadensis]
MKIGEPLQVLNPYDWLPGYGESKVAFCSDGLDIVVEIIYHRVGTDAEEFSSAKRTLCFKNVSSFIKLPFPGTAVFDFIGDAVGLELGRLTEFKTSDLLMLAKGSFGSEQQKHYTIQFLSENLSLHVVAEGYCLSEEIPELTQL